MKTKSKLAFYFSVNFERMQFLRRLFVCIFSDALEIWASNHAPTSHKVVISSGDAAFSASNFSL